MRRGYVSFERDRGKGTLTQILNPLIKCGFQIEAIEEAMPPADMMDMPGMCDEMRRPMMLLVKVKKV